MFIRAVVAASVYGHCVILDNDSHFEHTAVENPHCGWLVLSRAAALSTSLQQLRHKYWQQLFIWRERH